MVSRLSCIVLLVASLCAAQEIRTVIAEGVGNDAQNAAQDAAQNALTNVVGTFIDANKQLEKRSEIRDGIRSQTAQIRTDIKEYSQGSIQSFDIVEAKRDGPFFRVTAKVGVRVDDFRAYIKKLAEGETAVGGGLFAEMTTAQKQNDSLAKILSERILAVVNGEVVRFSVGEPVPFQQSEFAVGQSHPGNDAIWRLARRFGPDQLIVFKVTATLDKAFLANFVQTLDSVSASKKRVSTSSRADDPSSFWWSYTHGGNCTDTDSNKRSPDRTRAAIRDGFEGLRLPGFAGRARLAESQVSDMAVLHHDSRAEGQDQRGTSKFCLPVLDGLPGVATVYRFSNVDHEMAQYLPWMSDGGRVDLAGALVRGTLRLPSLEIALLDKDQKELQAALIEGRSDGAPKTAVSSPYPWLLYCPVSEVFNVQAAVLLRQRTFAVVMNVESEALKEASNIRVSLVK